MTAHKRAAVTSKLYLVSRRLRSLFFSFFQILLPGPEMGAVRNVSKTGKRTGGAGAESDRMSTGRNELVSAGTDTLVVRWLALVPPTLPFYTRELRLYYSSVIRLL